MSLIHGVIGYGTHAFHSKSSPITFIQVMKVTIGLNWPIHWRKSHITFWRNWYSSPKSFLAHLSYALMNKHKPVLILCFNNFLCKVDYTEMDLCVMEMCPGYIRLGIWWERRLFWVHRSEIYSLVPISESGSCQWPLLPTLLPAIIFLGRCEINKLLFCKTHISFLPQYFRFCLRVS